MSGEQVRLQVPPKLYRVHSWITQMIVVDVPDISFWGRALGGLGRSRHATDTLECLRCMQGNTPAGLVWRRYYSTSEWRHTCAGGCFTTSCANNCPRSFLADRTATQYDRLLASSCCPSVRLSVRLSVCDAEHCGSQGRCRGLKVVPTWS